MDNPNVVLVGDNDVAFDKLFRTALGGFNKDDVINYLERMARNRKKESERYAAHIRELETRIAELSEGHEDVRTVLPGDDHALSVLQSENAALRSEIEVLRLAAAEPGAAAPAEAPAEAAEAAETAEAPCFEVENSALAEQNRELNARNQSLCEQLAALEEKLRAYELEKLRLSEIEDAAHRSAERIEAEARAKADAAMASVAARAAAMQEKLAEVTRGIDETTRAIYAELSDCGLRYSALRREADDLRAELKSLSK